MGTWGIRTFENDDASDWAADLQQSKGNSLLKSSLGGKHVEGSYLEAPECVRILCAGEVILGITAKPRPSIPEDVVSWIAAHKELHVGNLVPLAVAGVQEVLSNDSELNELWAENEEDYSRWKQDVTGLWNALKSCQQQPEIPRRPWWKLR
jgi:hypothetical protein